MEIISKIQYCDVLLTVFALQHLPLYIVYEISIHLQYYVQ